MEQAGMGVGVGDYDLDGHLDIFKTHFADDANILYHNDGKGNFEDVTTSSRLGVETRYVCWGDGIEDLDNDGYPDRLMVTGHVYPEIERRLPQYPNQTPRAVFRNLGNGTFEELVAEAGPGVAAVHCSRGCAFGDFDNDGDLDVLISNNGGAPLLLRNDGGNRNNWLGLQLVATKSNPAAVGAIITWQAGGATRRRLKTNGGSYLASHDPREILGSGKNKIDAVEIRWPSGRVDKLSNPPMNTYLKVVEGEGLKGESVKPGTASRK